MVYVHGHPRDLGWVVAHFRRPHRPDTGQLPLALPPPDPGALRSPVIVMPTPREPGSPLRELRGSSSPR